MTPHGYPSDLYHCLLDEQPYYLIPLRLLPEYVPEQEYIVNPNCWFSWHGPLMPDKAARAAWIDDLCPSERIVWVDDPATGILWPFWVGDEYFSYLSQLAPGYPVTFDLPEHVKWVLMCANIFTTPNWTARRRHDWMETVHQASASFERGYVPVSGLIHPFHIGALRRYYRHQVRTGAFKLGDGQVSQRYAKHNEKVTRFFHHQLAGAVSAIARTIVKPSYSYFVAYESGSVLNRHTDRAQCDYSVTLCIDASPEPEGVSPWSIDLLTADGVLQVWQHLGDALVYRGMRVPHSRGRLDDGCTSSSMLLHYVAEDFQGSLT